MASKIPDEVDGRATLLLSLQNELYLNVSSSLLLMFLRTWVEFQTKMFLACSSKLEKQSACLRQTLYLRILIAACFSKDWLIWIFCLLFAYLNL